MLTATRISEEIGTYRYRLELLYQDVRRWIMRRRPDAVFSHAPVELNEESTGPYAVQSLDVSLPGLLPFRFVPRGIFALGARGRVDLRGRLGPELLFWVLATDAFPEESADPQDLASLPVFDNVAEGWAWNDTQHHRLVELSSDAFWHEALAPLIQ